jgi:hypothetical protein
MNNRRYLPRAVSSITPSTDLDNVIDFPKSITTSPFDRLTVRLVIDQHRRGVLQESLLIALLAGVGLLP